MGDLAFACAKAFKVMNNCILITNPYISRYTVLTSAAQPLVSCQLGNSCIIQHPENQERHRDWVMCEVGQ